MAVFSMLKAVYKTDLTHTQWRMDLGNVNKRHNNHIHRKVHIATLTLSSRWHNTPKYIQLKQKEKTLVL